MLNCPGKEWMRMPSARIIGIPAIVKRKSLNISPVLNDGPPAPDIKKWRFFVAIDVIPIFITLCYFYFSVESTPGDFDYLKECPHLDSMSNVLKTRDLAILLDMSPDAVNDLARKGLLKGYKSGNQWRFRRKDVERFLGKEQKKMAPPG